MGQRREPEIITHCSTVEPIHIQLSVIILPDAFTCAWKLTSSSRSTTGPKSAFNLFESALTYTAFWEMTKCKNVQHIFLADKPSFLKLIESDCDKVMLQSCRPLAVKATHNRAAHDR